MANTYNDIYAFDRPCSYTFALFLASAQLPCRQTGRIYPKFLPRLHSSFEGN